MEIVVIDEKELKRQKRKMKIQTAKAKVKAKVEAAKQWASQNQEKAFLIAAGTASVTVKAVASTVKQRRKRKNLAKEEELKEEYCYDRSLGHYWRLRRKLTNDEWLEIDRRKKNGERLADILADMKVLY